MKEKVIGDVKPVNVMEVQGVNAWKGGEGGAAEVDVLTMADQQCCCVAWESVGCIATVAYS